MRCDISTYEKIEELYIFAKKYDIVNELDSIMDVLHLSYTILVDRLYALDKTNSVALPKHIYIIFNCLCELKEGECQTYRKSVNDKIKRPSYPTMSPLKFYKQFTYRELEYIGI